jgi:ribonuclease Z
MTSIKNIVFLGTVLAVGIAIGAFLSQNESTIVPTAKAAGGEVESPVGIAPDRYVYYPGTEELDKNEIRLIAAGTGMPGARRGQAATCFLVELGDGQKFLFDIGTGPCATSRR